MAELSSFVYNETYFTSDRNYIKFIKLRILQKSRTTKNVISFKHKLMDSTNCFHLASLDVDIFVG